MDNTSNDTANIMTTVNEEARNVIAHTIELEKKCKLELLCESLKKVGEVCRGGRLSWFAMGKLLDFCVTGQDSYPEEYRYDIGMPRRDYETFMQHYARLEASGSLVMNSRYPDNVIFRRLTAYLSNRRKLKVGKSSLDVEIRLYIHPFDVLPSDRQERDRFIKEVSEMGCDLRRAMLSYRNFRRSAGNLKANPRRIPGVLLEKRRISSIRKNFNRKVDSYNKLSSPRYIGRIDQLVFPAFEYGDILPLKEKSFEGIPVMIPANPDKLAFLPADQEKERVLTGRLKAIDTFDSLCRENGLEYVAMEDLAVACSHPDMDVSDETLEAPWLLGMMRKDYDKALTLLSECSEEILIIRSEPLYPSICGDKVGICLKGYEERLPRQGGGTIYLIPFDVLPMDYDEKLAFTKEVKLLADNYQKQLRYEKGITDKEPDVRMNSWEQSDQLKKRLSFYNYRQMPFEQVYAILGSRMISMPYNEIFPAGRSVLCGQEISCPANPFFWYVKQDPAYTEYLAGRREEIMKEVDQICRDQGIDYFAMSNLLKGAVIYHDVMPRSDQRNMDFGLLRPDYEALVKVLREKGEDYGLTLHESLDGKGRYPLEVKYITKTGCRYSQARIRPLPFDKVPEDFYLYQGLRDEIDAKNEDYNLILKLYDPDLPNIATLPASLEEEKKEALLKTEPAVLAAEINKLAQSFNDDDRTWSYMWISFGKSKVITKGELFPLQRVKFRGMEINCPRDTSIWQPVLDSELERQVTCIQKADLILLEEFDKVCKKLGVGYFVCGGTMLGYMRHQGFIPWDDDVDVAMLRADYDRFMKEAGPLLPDRFFLQTRETDPNIPYLFSKIRLDDTEYITRYNDKREFHKGICLDIFPFDFLPEDEGERNRFVEEVRRLSREHHLIARRQFPIPEEECVPRNDQERRYIKEQKELLKSYWEMDLRESQQIYLDAATRYNSRAEELRLRTVGSFVPSYTFIDLNDLLPYQRGKFEGIEISVPKRPDIFLKMQYGDFMQLPPKHQQVAHRLLRWSTWEDRGEASAAGTDQAESS